MSHITYLFKIEKNKLFFLIQSNNYIFSDKQTNKNLHQIIVPCIFLKCGHAYVYSVSHRNEHQLHNIFVLNLLHFYN